MKPWHRRFFVMAQTGFLAAYWGAFLVNGSSFWNAFASLLLLAHACWLYDQPYPKSK